MSFLVCTLGLLFCPSPHWNGRWLVDKSNDHRFNNVGQDVVIQGGYFQCGKAIRGSYTARRTLDEEVLRVYVWGTGCMQREYAVAVESNDTICLQRRGMYYRLKRLSF